MIEGLPDISYAILPPVPPEAFWPFVITLAIFVIAIHVHVILRD